MIITINDLDISLDTKTIGFEQDNKVSTLQTIIVEAPYGGTYANYKLDMIYANGNTNIIDLAVSGTSGSVTLTSAMLGFNGKVMAQVRATKDDGTVAHTKTFQFWIKNSLNVTDAYDPIPSEFIEYEEGFTELYNHPPTPNTEGTYWMLWNLQTHAYVTSTIPLPSFNSLKILNKGVISSTESAVQTTATNYVTTEYSRQPQTYDTLVITLTDRDNDKVMYMYSSTSSLWINIGLNTVDLSKYLSVGNSQSFTDSEKLQGRTNLGFPSTTVNDRYLHTNSSTGALEWSEMSDKVFIAEYNVTSYDDLLEAYNAGKIIMCKLYEIGVYFYFSLIVYSTTGGFMFSSQSIMGNDNEEFLNPKCAKNGTSTVWSLEKLPMGEVFKATSSTTIDEIAEALENNKIIIFYNYGLAYNYAYDDYDSITFVHSYPANNQISFNTATINDSSNWSYSSGSYDIPQLPTVVNNRYLHTNATTGALEWAEVSSGSGVFIATYGTTTASEVAAARTAGKAVFCEYVLSSVMKYQMMLTDESDSKYVFSECAVTTTDGVTYVSGYSAALNKNTSQWELASGSALVPTISASSTGTSTNTVKYLTINSTEYKLDGGLKLQEYDATQTPEDNVLYYTLA